jgi:hypothetical protein
LPLPSFVERLKARGCSRVVSAYPGIGKDFNDWYRARLPDAQYMEGWMKGLGLAPSCLSKSPTFP